MADSDNSYKLLIELGLVGEEKAEAAKQSIEGITQTAGKLSEGQKELGSKTEEAGEKSEHSAQKHLHLRQLLGELNRITPGLGHAMHLVSEAYTEAGTKAADGAVGVAEFNTALSGVISTMGPVVIAMLGIEAAMKLWDGYKEKVEQAAKAQEEASQRIVDSTSEALKAVQELNEALNPKEKTLAEHDEEKLKKQLEQQDQLYKREQEINKQREQNALAAASSPEEKQAIQERFADLGKDLAVWNQKTRAAIEGAAAEAMGNQINEVQSKLQSLIAQSSELFKTLRDAPGDITDLNTQRAALFTSVTGGGGTTVDTTDYSKVAEKDKEITARKEQLEEAQREYNRIVREIKTTREQVGPLSEKHEDIQGQSDTDAGSAAADTRTNQTVRALRLTGRVEQAITNEMHAATVAEAKIALQQSQAVGRELVAAIREAHASNSDTQKQLLSEYRRLREKNTEMSRQITQATTAGQR